ncbi:MAG: hypothetical protein U0183_16365 [Polyangiaceae bacterium]
MRKEVAAVLGLSLCIGACGGDDSPIGRTCSVPGISYNGDEVGLVYMTLYNRSGRVVYRAVGHRFALDDRSTAVADLCFDLPFWEVTHVRAWIAVGETEYSPKCFGPESSTEACVPRPTDPQGEIAVSLKPREANRILVPLRKP